MKTELLFVLPSFGVGGTTLSTYNLISLLDKDKYNVSVLPMFPDGTFKMLYEEIGYITPSYLLNTISTHKKVNRNFVLNKLSYCLWLLSTKMRFVNFFLQKMIAIKISKRHYDTVVACQEGYCTEFSYKIKAKKHVAWIRCEFERYQKLQKGINLERIYEKYDEIVGVSENTVSQFSGLYPKLSDRIIAINNPQSSDFIIHQSEIDDHDCNFQNDKFTIVSVGRLDPIKRFSEIPRISKELLEFGLDFNWFIIGSGNDVETNNIKSQIQKNNMCARVKMLGGKSNAHFYIKRSDLMVCLSKSEACPRVINEAKILHVPVVCTDFNSAHEFIDSGINGVICSLEDVSDNIYKLYNDKEMYCKIKNNIMKFSFDNSEILSKITKVLDYS